mgnify:CR=1 FL=1
MFKCDNCGRCCTDTASQIALTAGDLVRISEHLKTSISSLFGKYVGFSPFRGEDPDLYEYELGLVIPCRFRQKQKCTIYDSRDLNSRLFPFWMLDAPDSLIDPGFGCLKQLKNLKDKEIYLDYKNKVGKMLLRESELTDEVINKLGARKRIDLKNHEKYQLLLDKYQFHELEVKKVELAIELRDDDFFKKFPELIEKEIMENKELISTIKKNNKELAEIEKTINNGDCKRD